MRDKYLTGDKQARRRRYRKRRIIVYGSLLAILYGAYCYQPWEYDFIPRRAPVPNPGLDPDTKTLFSPNANIVVVTAHPDDAEFYIAGSLLKLSVAGAQIHLIVCTSGDKGYYLFEDAAKNRSIREAEQREAASHYKAKEVIFLHHPDGRLRANDELVGELRDEIKRIHPNYVLCFDGDYPPRLSHQDHRRAGDAALAAAKQAGYPLWVMRFQTIAANYVVDISKLWDEKAQMLAIHKSQFHDERLIRVTNMVESLAIDDGDKVGVSYGEGFHVVRVKGER